MLNYDSLPSVLGRQGAFSFNHIELWGAGWECVLSITMS